jgi:RNA polymerase sigma-70 factor (ECF subfamily)
MSARSDRRLAEIEAAYRSRNGAFLRVATAITADPEAARDAVHDGFVSAVRGRKGFRGEAPLEAWLWRLVVNAALRRRQLRARAAEEELDPELEAPRRREDDDAVRRAVERLPERQRLVLFLRYFADLDYASIAAVAGIAPGTVGATLNAARRRVRELLEEVPACEM